MQQFDFVGSIFGKSIDLFSFSYFSSELSSIPAVFTEGKSFFVLTF